VKPEKQGTKRGEGKEEKNKEGPKLAMEEEKQTNK